MTICPCRTFLLVAFLLGSHVSSGFAQVTRIDQNDPSIVYSGNWYSNESDQHIGGSAALTNTRGARATITFNGTGITWFGVIDGWAGLATIYLDGSMKIIDSYGSNARYQAPLFVARGLSEGPHTLAIEVTHERGPNTDGSWVWVDAFDIENGTAVPGGLPASTGRVEENDPSLIYFGRWFTNGNPAHSGGSAALATDAGSRLDINFRGTGIRWLAYRDEWSGLARIFIDGELQAETDNYQAPSVAQTVLYEIGGLSRGTHTLGIEVTGTRNSSSNGSWIWIDAFDIAP